jgi:hypothetical protein
LLQFDHATPTVLVYDVAGRLVQTIPIMGENTLILGQGLPSGLYIIRAGTELLRIVKQAE